MPKQYKTQFYEDFNYIAIAIERNGKPEVYRVRLNARLTKKLRDYFKPSLNVGT